MRRTAIALALLIVPVLALSGCTPTPPPAVTAPKPSSTPLFATEDEALKAATEAYAAYVEVSDQIFVDGGNGRERLATVSTGDQLEVNLDGYAQAAAKGLRSTGGTTFDHVELEQYVNARHGTVLLYLCEDVSQVNVFDSSGASVVSSTRPDRAAYEVSFDWSRPASGHLLVASKERISDYQC